MTFIVTLIALLIERFFDWSHLRNWSWFGACQRLVASKLTGKSADLIFAGSILPLALAVLVVQYLLKETLYGVGGLVLDLVVLLYCLGPQNLWADTFACLNALVQGDAKTASDKLKSSFGLTDMSFAQSVHGHFLDSLFTQANQRVFAVVFWFFVMGPAGAVMYRLVSISASTPSSGETLPEMMRTARNAEAVLNWAPIRLLTFIFALGGNFAKVFTPWKRNVVLGLPANQAMLTDCGLAALGYSETDHLPEDGSAERLTISLLDRSFLIALAVMLVLVLVL